MRVSNRICRCALRRNCVGTRSSRRRACSKPVLSKPALVQLFERLRDAYDDAAVTKALAKALRLPETQLAYSASSKKLADLFVASLTNRDTIAAKSKVKPGKR